MTKEERGENHRVLERPNREIFETILSRKRQMSRKDFLKALSEENIMYGWDTSWKKMATEEKIVEEMRE